MKVLGVAAILMVGFIAFCEGISLLDKHDLKVGKAHSIHMKVKKHHHNHHKSMLRGKHLKLDEGGFHTGRKSKFDDKWMAFPKKSAECTLKCGHKKFCMRDPSSGAEKCIKKSDFKESRRLFRDFHREKQILKKDKQKDYLDSKLSQAERMKDVYELIDEYNKKHDKKVHMKPAAAKTLDKTPVEVTEDTAQECRPTELYELKKRMVGWFVLMHTESRRSRHKMNHKKHGKHGRKYHKKNFDFMAKTNKFHHFDSMDSKVDMKKSHMKEITRGKRSVADTVSTESHKCKCAKSVMWEFRKQDKDRNRLLSGTEVEVMAANRREPCMKPLLKTCDTDGDGALTHGEWCCCMAYTIPPCLEKKRLTDPKDWVPRCDKEGFYKREQCHDASGYCWCVDINGNEIVGSKKLGGGHCGHYDPNGRLDVKKN